jgi:2-keto-4-pentenoate hydratase/2-oxohepta-3-ene-1,7-dioic acid hydratase in catechol pathway
MPAAPWKKLVRFIAAEDGLVYTGEPLETADADLGLALKEGKPIRVRCLQGSVLSPRSALGSRLMTVKQLLSPLDPAVIKTVRALGINFKPTPEFKRTPIPVLFYKPTSTISHTGAVLPLPKFARDEQADYEVELCVVIGKRCKDVTEEEALDYVLGYTVAQDVRYLESNLLL